jgi:uncharacterized membrane protein
MKYKVDDTLLIGISVCLVGLIICCAATILTLICWGLPKYFGFQGFVIVAAIPSIYLAGYAASFFVDWDDQ